MKKIATTLIAVFGAFGIVGTTAVLAVSSNYPGKLQLKFGADGISLQIEGAPMSK